MPAVFYEVAVIVALLGILGTAIATLIKVRPLLRELDIAEKKTLRGENREDLSDCQKQIAALRIEMDTMRDTVTNLKIEMSGVLTAYRILEVSVETRDPNDTALRQARAVLSTAFAIAPSTGSEQ